MNYVLSVLTHGDNKELLDGLIHSFSANVTPAPAACVVVQDGPCELPPMASLGWQATQLSPQGGFCEASEEMWSQSIRAADEAGADYVFWLEHDFRFKRPVDVRSMRTVLECLGAEKFAQVSLMRQPCNPMENRAGGVVEALEERGYLFKSRCSVARDPVNSWLTVGWLEHCAYFTTNPSLMSVDFMARNPWPTGDQCEGRFGIDLVARGYNFAILGDGTPWIEHVGIRDGTGVGY